MTEYHCKRLFTDGQKVTTTRDLEFTRGLFGSETTTLKKGSTLTVCGSAVNIVYGYQCSDSEGNKYIDIPAFVLQPID